MELIILLKKDCGSFTSDTNTRGNKVIRGKSTYTEVKLRIDGSMRHKYRERPIVLQD